MKNSRNINPARWLIVTYIVGLVVMLYFNLSQSNEIDVTNKWITAIFFIIVAACFVSAYGCLKRGNALILALDSVEKKIGDLKDQSRGEILAFLFEQEKLFGNSTLDKIFDAYKEDTSLMNNNASGTNVNMEDYINQNIVDSEISMHFLNQIPGLMTGLGILGTFVGLSFGLNAFDFSQMQGSNDALLAGIEPLMNGIKVAFHTSIYGLIFSLLFNVFYRKNLATIRSCINSFLDMFQKYVVSVSDNGTSSTFIKYQQNIFELLGQQLEVQRYQAEVSANMGESIKTEISDLIETKIVPEVQKMSVSVDKFAEATLKDQQEELGKIVNEFVTKMHSALGDSFSELGKVIEETNEWQKKSLAEMQEVLSSINTMATDMDKMNKAISDNVEKVTAFTTSIVELQENVKEEVGALEEQIQINNQIATSQKETFDVIVKRSQEVELVYGQLMDKLSSQIEATANMTSKAQDMQVDYITSLQTKLTEEINGIVDIMQKKLSEIDELNSTTTKSMTDAAKELGKVANGLANNMDQKTKDTFATFDEALSDIVSHFSSTLQQMNLVLDRVPIVTETVYGDMDEKFDNMQKLLDQYLEYTYQLHHNLELKWHQLEKEV